MSGLKKQLMGKIQSDEVRMRSRSVFVFAKAAVEVLLMALLVFAVYLINLSFYLPKRDFKSPASGPRLGLLLGTVPWLYLIAGALGLAIAFWVLYRFTGAYKKHFVIAIGTISLLVLAISIGLASSNFNERIQERQPLRGLYHMDGKGTGLRDGSGSGMMRNLK